MPVTELAILPLGPRVDPSDESFRAKLLRAREVMETALGMSGRRFVYFQGVEDPRVLYLLGDWRSPAEHWDHFIPGPENQELLALLGGELDLSRIEMYHVDVPIADVPADAHVISIAWHRVRGDDKAAFEQSFSECRKWLDEYVSGHDKPAGGWRVEKAAGMENEEEWVLFGGWKTVDEHNGFAKSEAFQKYERIRDVVQGIRLKHGTRMELN